MRALTSQKCALRSRPYENSAEKLNVFAQLVWNRGTVSKLTCEELVAEAKLCHYPVFVCTTMIRREVPSSSQCTHRCCGHMAEQKYVYSWMNQEGEGGGKPTLSSTKPVRRRLTRRLLPNASTEPVFLQSRLSIPTWIVTIPSCAASFWSERVKSRKPV